MEYRKYEIMKSKFNDTYYNYIVTDIECQVCIYCHDVKIDDMHNGNGKFIYCYDENKNLVAHIACSEYTRC